MCNAELAVYIFNINDYYDCLFSVEMYNNRPKDQEKHMEHFTENMTALEKQLTKSQSVVTVRGKRGSPVPILIPSDCQPIMDMLSTPSVRSASGISQENPYLFANFSNYISI